MKSVVNGNFGGIKPINKQKLPGPSNNSGSRFCDLAVWKGLSPCKNETNKIVMKQRYIL